MMIRDLQPPLSVIEHDLFADAEPMEPSPPLIEPIRPDHADALTATAEPPPYLREAIERRVRAHAAHASDRPLAAGQIRRIAEVMNADGSRRALLRPVALLLDRAVAGTDRWTGWLVAADVDYASAWDVLLEADVDEPFDPAAGMVQLWNPVTCAVSPGADLLAQLSAERLAALRAAAECFPHLERAGTPRPGFVAPRTVAGAVLLTGSPLGDSADPRRAYQSLYLQLALALGAPAGAGQADGKVVPLGRSATPRKPHAWQRQPNLWVAIAATVMVVQGGVIGFLLQPGPGDEAALYRSAGPAAERQGQIEVSFRPEAPEAEIRRLLIDIGGEIVGGPGQLGYYRIHLKDGDVARAMDKLKASPVVDSVESVVAKGGK